MVSPRDREARFLNAYFLSWWIHGMCKSHDGTISESSSRAGFHQHITGHTSRYNSPFLVGVEVRTYRYVYNEIEQTNLVRFCPPSTPSRLLRRIRQPNDPYWQGAIRGGCLSQLACGEAIIAIRHPRNKRKDLTLTFSSILDRGPPPPSPLPKTSNEVSDDSRFCQLVVSLIAVGRKIAYFMIRQSFVDIINRCLRSVGVD